MSRSFGPAWGQPGLRVNVQLIDAETRAHPWVDRFDKPMTDLLESQVCQRAGCPTDRGARGFEFTVPRASP
jgi:hypothetical protein